MAVDVGSAVGYLDLDTSGFLNSLRSAQSEANRTANNMSKSFGGSMKSLGEGMTKIGGFATAGITTPIVTAVTASVKQFAKLEQSIGGVETLFKKSAPRVIKNSETAYKRAGVDANKYMEQVTSFSATLLQGLGGDTEKAAKYADKAIVDMSDNANKMGTDIGLIQDAYQGFAKDNYTMLDNLKLGYGGTQSEMARLVNDSGVLNGKFKATAENVKDIPFNVLIDAIHRTQEKLGITGTTAKEAQETVSGSFEMMKSSVLNFLQQLGNPGADMDKFAQQMIQSIGVFVDNIKRVLGTIWDNLPISPLQKKLITAAAAFGPVMIAGGKVISTVGSITDNIGKAIPLVSQFASGFISAGAPLAEGASSMTAFGAAIGTVIGPILAIVAVVATLVAAFKHLWDTNEEFRNKITSIWDGIKSKFESFVQGIVDRLNALGFNFKDIVDVIKSVWDGFCNLLAPVFEGAFNQISVILGSVLDALTGIFDVFIGVFTGNWSQAWQGVKEIFGAVWDLIKGTFETFISVFKGLVDAVLDWFGTSWNELWTNVGQFFSNVWNGIVSFFSNIISSITSAVSNFISAIINFFSQLPTNIANFITNAYKAVVTWVSNMVAKAKEVGTNFLSAVVSFFTQLPGKILQFITSALNNIKTWVTNMVNKAREMGTNFINNVVSFFTQLPGKILQFITSALNNVKTWVTNMVNKAKEMGTNFINNVVSFFTQLPGKIQQFLTSAFNNVKTWATDMANKAKEAATKFLNNVVNKITDLPGKIKKYLDDVISDLKSWVTDMGKKGTDAIQSLIKHVIDGAKNIGSSVLSIGSDIVSGVWRGIVNAKSTFVSNVKGFFSGIVGTVKKALGIGSPSKVFRDEIGRWLPPGVAQGFEAAMPSAMKSIQKDLNKGIDNLDVNDISVNASANVSGFADKLKSIYNDVALWFESIESRIGGSIDSMMKSLDMLIRAGRVIVGSDGTLGYINYNGFAKTGGSKDYVDRNDPRDKTPSGNGDTYIFNSPKAIDEIEAAKQIKKTKQDIAEGF